MGANMKMRLVIVLLAIAGRVAAEQVDSWSVAKVNEWVDAQGLEAGTAAKVKDGFTKNNVDGTVLLHVTEEDIKEDLGIESGLQRKVLVAGIAKLKAQNPSHGKMDFWQYRSMNRKQIDGLVFVMSAAPRVAIHRFHELPEHGQPPPLDGATGWLEWLLVPNYHIYMNSDKIAGGLPGFFSIIILANLGVKICKLLALLGGGNWKGLLGLLGEFTTEFVAAILNFIIMNVIWPFVPAVICNIFFYMAVYVAPVGLLIQSLLSLLVIVGVGGALLGAAAVTGADKTK